MNNTDRKELTNFWKHGINPITGFKEYYYYIQASCEICEQPHFKRKGSPSKSHGECKMKPFRKDKNE